MTNRKDFITGIVLAAFSAAYMAASFSISLFKGSGSAPLDARFVPQMWAVCLFILSVALILRGLKSRKTVNGESAEKAPSLKEFFAKYYEAILTFAALFLYIALMEPIGFLIMSALYVFAQILILSKPGKRNLLIAAITGVVSSVAVNYVFVVLLSVMLPRGILGF
jgi:putative tricarboxylic transport membrane protein